MTLRLSTLLRQQLTGVRETYAAATIAAVDTPTLDDSNSQFLIEGFRPGILMEVSGFTGTAANDQLYVVGDVTAGSMAVTVEVALVNDAEGETVTLTMYPQSFRDCFTRGILAIYTGSQPATADVAPTGTLLLLISESSGAFVAGAVANGLQWDEPVAGVIGKNSTAWSDAGLATGTAGWFRFWSNSYNTIGAATGAACLCFDGAVGTSGAELNLSSTSIVLAATTTIDEFEVTLPVA
jgi:hypothetical protein